MDVKISPAWKELLKDEFEKTYFKELVSFVKSEYATKKVYPPGKLIFNAFDTVAPEDIKVVILGQDPYHGPGQAHGLSFSVPLGIPTPKSLINIFKEIESDLGTPPPNNGNLERWATQGVFLLNASLTVRAGEPSSHQKSGWMQFTDKVIEKVSENCEHVVFMLWGNFAKEKMSLIDQDRHLILTSTHPSPFSAHKGFLGSKQFSRANAYLENHGKTPIKW
ncbi:uracil-DNA glycosylase [Flavobacteriaceae bacterium Ap0902]|nr:uracil-DNA glycosylase [Flavobacteriaceae bacterium Ap0902]